MGALGSGEMVGKMSRLCEGDEMVAKDGPVESLLSLELLSGKGSLSLCSDVRKSNISCPDEAVLVIRMSPKLLNVSPKSGQS